MIMGKDKKTDPVKTATERKKALAQRKKILDLDEQIADLQIRKANAADDRGSGEGAGDFWSDWYGKDWDW